MTLRRPIRRISPCHLLAAAATIMILMLGACSPVKHVPQGQYLVEDVDMTIENPDGEVRQADLVNYLRQTPNHKVLGFLKLQLATYSLSGADSTRWYNRWLRRLGQPPVIYDPKLTVTSEKQLRQALINRGYMEASVEADTVTDSIRRRVSVDYRIATGAPHRISSVEYDIPDTAIARLVLADSALFTLAPGQPFDRNRLDSERAMITQRLRNRGYYAFTKEYITFVADTAEGSYDVGLTMQVRPPRSAANANVADTLARHQKYFVRDVYFITDYSPETGTAYDAVHDTVRYNGIDIIYGSDHYIKPKVLEEKCFIRPGELYRAYEADRTYEALAQLGILHSINIELAPAGSIGDNGLLDAYIYLTRNKSRV